jgi:hypothetical protein
MLPLHRDRMNGPSAGSYFRFLFQAACLSRRTIPVRAKFLISIKGMVKCLALACFRAADGRPYGSHRSRLYD